MAEDAPSQIWAQRLQQRRRRDALGRVYDTVLERSQSGGGDLSVAALSAWNEHPLYKKVLTTLRKPDSKLSRSAFIEDMDRGLPEGEAFAGRWP